jgi:polyhydroxyalkanoate synthesis regulator phasin
MIASPEKGQPIPNDDAAAWKRQAYLMADLAEAQRDEIRALRQRVNTLEQKLFSLRNLRK